MNTVDIAVPNHQLEAPPVGTRTMYAIAFDLDTELLAQMYPGPSWNNAYRDIREALRDRGFVWQQGSVYFGDRRVRPVTCVLAIQELTTAFSWFSACARDVRMLRIEENDDLRPAIDAAL
jgi:virulence-associated protein VapD